MTSTFHNMTPHNSATWLHSQFKKLGSLECWYTFLPWETLETWERIDRHRNYSAVLGVKRELHFTGQNSWRGMSMQSLKQQLKYEVEKPQGKAAWAGSPCFPAFCQLTVRVWCSVDMRGAKQEEMSCTECVREEMKLGHQHKPPEEFTASEKPHLNKYK